MSIRKKWENSDTIDEYIIKEEGVNVLLPTAQYENIYNHRYNFFGLSKQLARCVIVEYGAIR